ncbi:MAG: type IV toxin-antitoxin system AbiEi family antitoxin domain-containing protein [Terrabacter sp.]
MDAVLRARAAGQSGLVSRAQALSSGMSRKAIECRLASGRWAVVHPGIYQTMPGRQDWETSAVAALLHAGRGSALCDSSAGYLWGIVRAAPDPVRVIVPASRRVRNVPGVIISRSRHAIGRIDPIAWPHRTTVEHTVLDLSAGRGPDRAIAVAAKAMGLELTSPDRLRQVLVERPRQRDRALLLDIFAEVADGCESPAERRYIRDVERAHGLPPGRSQTPFGRAGRRDREYEYGVVAEVDGRLGHGGWLHVQRDGRRDRAATVAGRTTLRCYWSDLVPTACDLALEVALVLRAKGWEGRPRACSRTCSVGAEAPLWNICPR